MSALTSSASPASSAAVKTYPSPAIAAVAQSRGMATAIIAFADPLRQAAAAAYGINAAEFTDDTLKTKSSRLGASRGGRC